MFYIKIFQNEFILWKNCAQKCINNKIINDSQLILSEESQLILGEEYFFFLRKKFSDWFAN